MKKDIDYSTLSSKDHKESKFFRYVGVVLLIFCLSVLSFVGGRIFEQYEGDSVRGPLDAISGFRRSAEVKEVFNEDLFWSVWNTIENKYVDEEAVDEEKMFYGAVKGVVSSLEDPGTVFLDPEESELFEKQSRGEYFEGIGAELGYSEGSIIVIAPIAGSPAKEAGVQARDTIVKVDDVRIKQSHSIYEVVDKIRGEAGTEVILTVMREGESELRDIEITRGEITVPSMELVKDDDSGIHILDVSRFTESNIQVWNSVWDSTIEEFLETGKNELIIDLRGNPGGFFDSGVYAAEEFLPRETVIAKQEDRQSNVKEYTVTREGNLLDTEVVVLVDRGSASASEIFAGALQQNERAIIVGESTYGKGTAQDMIDFRDGSSLHLTVIKWLLPDGSWLKSDNVIEPDKEVEFTQEDFKEGDDPQLEKALDLLRD